MIGEGARRELAEGFAQGWREAGESDGKVTFWLYLAVGIGSAVGTAAALAL